MLRHARDTALTCGVHRGLRTTCFGRLCKCGGVNLRNRMGLSGFRLPAVGNEQAGIQGLLPSADCLLTIPLPAISSVALTCAEELKRDAAQTAFALASWQRHHLWPPLSSSRLESLTVETTETTGCSRRLLRLCLCKKLAERISCEKRAAEKLGE